jgi:hypothetical protein
MKEHKTKEDSAIQLHLRENPTHRMNAENAKIADSAANNRKLLLIEAFQINKRKPELNTQHTAHYKTQNKDGVPFGSLRNTIIFGCKAYSEVLRTINKQQIPRFHTFYVYIISILFNC